MPIGPLRIYEKGDTFLAVGADHNIPAGNNVEYRVTDHTTHVVVNSGFVAGPINSFLIHDTSTPLTPSTTYLFELIETDPSNNVVSQVGLFGITAPSDGFTDVPGEGPGDSFVWCGHQYGPGTPDWDNQNQLEYSARRGGYGQTFTRPATAGAGMG